MADRCYVVDTPAGPIRVRAGTPPSPELVAAFTALADEARNRMAEDPGLAARQAAARARNHARLHRLGLTDCQEDHT